MLCEPCVECIPTQRHAQIWVAAATVMQVHLTGAIQLRECFTNTPSRQSRMLSNTLSCQECPELTTQAHQPSVLSSSSFTGLVCGLK